jgi:Carboxypeptidase regulatory-like domain
MCRRLRANDLLNSSLSPALLCLLGAAAVFVVPGVAAGQTATASPVNTAGSFRVAGTILSKTDAHPLGHARVTLRDAKNPGQFESVITEENGKFAFENVPAGKYSLTGAKRGFITASYDQHDQFSTAIVTGTGIDTGALVLKIAPNAVITGKVLDEAGEPVRHATVTLYYDDHQEGVDQIQVRNVAQTDDLGAYDLPNLIPGTYFLSVRATPWYAVHPPEDSGPKSEIAVDRSLDVAYPLTYYTDATDSDGATAIPVQGGERLQVDMHLNPVPALHLRVHVPGDNKHGFTFPRLEQPAFDGSTFMLPSGGRMVSPGVFEISGIPAGHYNLRIQGQGVDIQMNGVDLNKDGEQVDAAAAEPTASLKLSVHTPEETAWPKGLTVALRSKGRSFAGWRRLDEKGEGEIADIPAGNYEVVVFGSRKRYSIAHMLAEGAEVSGHRLTLGPGASASVSLQLVAGSGDIEGVVKKAGTCLAGAMVVLVPKDPEGNRDLFRRDQSDLDGTFSLHDVVPGSYFLLAIENGWDLDWSQPAVIAAYSKHGRAIVVSDSLKQLNLAEPIQVQSK